MMTPPAPETQTAEAMYQYFLPAGPAGGSDRERLADQLYEALTSDEAIHAALQDTTTAKLLQLVREAYIFLSPPRVAQPYLCKLDAGPCNHPQCAPR